MYININDKFGGICMIKKIGKIMVVMLFMFTITFTLVACDGDEPLPVTKLTVIFDVNAGNDAVQNEPDVVRVDEGTSVSEPTPDPIRDGYDFVGWFTNADGTGSAYDFSSSITTNNFVLYAVWSETVTYYSVILDYQGSETNVTLTLAEGQTVDEPNDPSREGYRFAGWYIDEAFSSAYNFSTTVDTDFSLYVKWVEQITLNFESNNGSAIDSQVIDINTVASIPVAPTRVDYTFGGWFLDEQLSTPFDFDSSLSSDTTIYAKWVDSSAPTFTVQFDLNYINAPNIDDQTIVEGAIITQPTTNRTGYRFAGWYTDQALTTSFSVSTPITADLILYAKWIETVILSIDYNYESAVNPGAITVDKDAAIAAIQNPSRTGYTFAGWSASANGLVGYDYQIGINTDTTIYAQWSKTFVFEAEDLDFTGFEGPGYSGAAFGTDVITADSVSASNGYFVTYLYAEGIALTYTIESDRAVDNVTLVLRLSAEVQDFYIAPNAITPETPVYTVTVNGTPIMYSPIYFDDVPSVGEHLPFNDYTLSVNVSLVEGTNTIILLTDNDIAMAGTMTATAPMVDCIKIETYANLTWEPVDGNY